MSHCELCGKETALFKVAIEGTDMFVCSNCAKFGQIKERPKIPAPAAQKIFPQAKSLEPALEVTEVIVKDYAKKIRQAREKLGLNQEDFAKKINEKESLLQKMETGTFEPSLALARKLEKLLGLKLIEKFEEKKLSFAKESSEGMTLGDFINR